MRTLLRILILVAFGLVMSGVNYCRKDFEIGAQSNASATPTVGDEDDDENDPNDDGTEDDDDGTNSTPTPAATATPEPTATTTNPTATPTPTTSAIGIADTAIARAAEGKSIITGLSELETETNAGHPSASGRSQSADEESQESDSAAGGHLVAAPANAADIKSTSTSASNWLGKAYEDGADGAALDTDGDGYTDSLELDYDSNPDDPDSSPVETVTSLAARFRNIDDDLDGINNNQERAAGTDPYLADSDGDGVRDGAEILSGSNPTNADDRPIDQDGDGLSDSYEASLGTNPASPDTDGDRLRDDHEVAFGADPLDRDSDKDGILDGKEVEIGSDPVVSEKR